VNRKADFFTQRIDSHNESNRFESRIVMLYRQVRAPDWPGRRRRQDVVGQRCPDRAVGERRPQPAGHVSRREQVRVPVSREFVLFY